MNGKEEDGKEPEEEKERKKGKDEDFKVHE